jgi:hypothetical protein
MVKWRYSSTILNLGTGWTWVVSFAPLSFPCKDEYDEFYVSYNKRCKIWLRWSIINVSTSETRLTMTSICLHFSASDKLGRHKINKTPWSRVLLGNQTVTQLVKKFPAFYGTRRLITAFTRAGRNINSQKPLKNYLLHASLCDWVTSWKWLYLNMKRPSN